MAFLLLLGFFLPLADASSQPSEVLVLCDFEARAWPELMRTEERAKQGKFSGKWTDVKKRSSIRAAGAPRDWSRYDRLCFWLYSEKANNQRLTIVCNSDNKEDKTGWDYFYYHFKVDWQGWKFFNLQLGDDIKPTRKPIGWHQIGYFSINASGWQNRPLSDTTLFFDDVKLVRDPVGFSVKDRKADRSADGTIRVSYTLEITNRLKQPRTFGLSTRRIGEGESHSLAYQIAGLPEQTSQIAPGEALLLPIALTASPADLKKREPLTREEIEVQIRSDAPDTPGPTITLAAATPIPKREHPFLFADSKIIADAKARAQRHRWAKKELDSIIRAADGIVKAKLIVPDEPGQWSHHYVCKKCGAGLLHKNGKHICGKCGAEYKGWPYDQVVIAGVHSSNWRNVRTLGLAYAFTENEAYAQRAREILLAYAEKYLTYPLHNVRGSRTRSAGRVFAQTLDESVAIIGVAWGYDLIYNSPCLSKEDREKIESKFLRQVVETVRRNNAGVSNWQSWHNAGMAAVGFCLQDQEIASLAINGGSGLRFQLTHSILKDGFWYEGTPAYHYYALDALRWTTEAAYFAGIDFYDDAAYKSLYDAPLLYVFPNMKFPAVNDSDVFSIAGRRALYELAYARFGDPNYLPVAQKGKRSSLEALLWGVEELPAAEQLTYESKDFRGLGAAVLRQGSGGDQIYCHLDYGPHGGGHGHLDKLAMILFALGRQLAPDPGRVAYGAPLQGSWYRQTFAHNTVCVDGRSQRPTTGKLTMFHSQPGFAIAQAECATAYTGVRMRRTLALTPDYLIDIFIVESEEEHTYDWLYHNFGDMKPGIPTTRREEPLGKGWGYQHLTDIREAKTAETWFVDFVQSDANCRVTMLPAPDTELFFGVGMANNPPAPCPMAVARRRGKRRSFVSVIEPYREKPAVLGLRAIAVTGDDALALEIDRHGAPDLFMIANRGGVQREFGGVRSAARACFVRTAGGKQRQVY